MAIKEYKIFLTPEDYEHLKQIAASSGYTGRGAVSHFIKKIATEPICFLDSNVQKMLEVLKVSVKLK